MNRFSSTIINWDNQLTLLGKWFWYATCPGRSFVKNICQTLIVAHKEVNLPGTAVCNYFVLNCCSFVDYLL